MYRRQKTRLRFKGFAIKKSSTRPAPLNISKYDSVTESHNIDRYSVYTCDCGSSLFLTRALVIITIQRCVFVCSFSFEPKVKTRFHVPISTTTRGTRITYFLFRDHIRLSVTVPDLFRFTSPSSLEPNTVRPCFRHDLYFIFEK